MKRVNRVRDQESPDPLTVDSKNPSMSAPRTKAARWVRMGKRTHGSLRAKKYKAFRVLIEEVLRLLKKFARIRNVFIAIFVYFLTYGVFLQTMHLQHAYSHTQELSTALHRATVPPKTGVTYLDWLKTQ
ncbi:hypothetical protein CYMTET_16875, partial [Cymbomonas tetramitiformis]